MARQFTGPLTPSIRSMFLVAVLVPLAQPVKNGTNKAIIQDDKQDPQCSVKAAHEHKVAWIIHPLKDNWQHDSSPFLIRIKLPFLREYRQIAVGKHDHDNSDPYRQKRCCPFNPVGHIVYEFIKRHDGNRQGLHSQDPPV